MKCKYWDCGFCYAPNYVVTSASSSSSCNYPEHCPYLKTEMTDKQPEVISSGTAIISDENGVPTKVHCFTCNKTFATLDMPMTTDVLKDVCDAYRERCKND